MDSDISNTVPQVETPEWFQRALSVPQASRFVEIEGCEVHYLRWGDPANPGVVFLPGAGGHAHWFSHIVPLLADTFHVVAMEPGGMGDSERRNAYSLDLIIAEVMGVCAHAGMFDVRIPPVIVGHSMGGQFAVRTGIAEGEHLLGVVAVDALRQALLDKDPAVAIFQSDEVREPRPRRPAPDKESLAARFRLQPEPEIEIETTYVLDHIAQNSGREEEDGWVWKMDPNFVGVGGLGLDLKDELTGLACKAAVVFGEFSHIVDENTIARMDEATGGTIPSFIIPGTTHYPMIDSPLAFISAIRAILSLWVAEARQAQKR